MSDVGIAPRDIVPGRDWGGAIVEAIGNCQVMVLIFSAYSNDSPQIRREVERRWEMKSETAGNLERR